MSYTTLDQVAGMLPTFKRGIPQQNPPDTLIQNFIDDVAGDLDAILQRRFGEAIGASPYNGSFVAWAAAFSTDQLNALEKINRYGAAQQLCQTLASFGVAAAREMAAAYQSEYQDLRNQLDARSKDGKPLASGLYDHLFDAQARTETPRPGLEGVAGADQPKGQTAADLGMSSVFSKFDRTEG
jgi:hypothetical protein